MSESVPVQSLEEFARTVTRAQRRVAGIHLRAAHPTQPERQSAFDEASTELLALVESLQVAEVELRAQNEELAAARDALEEERRRFQELFDFAPDAYIVTDARGVITRANLRAAAMFGVDRRFLIEKPLATFVDDEGRRAFRRQLDCLCGAGSSGEWTVTICPRYGRPFAAAVSAAATHARGGECAGLRWLVRDVSERDEAERAAAERNALLEAQLEGERVARLAAERASREKSEFLATLSHEFRTPLQAIGGYAAVLSLGIHGPLEERQRADLARIQLAEEHLLGLVNSILELSRLESGRSDVQLTDVRFGELLPSLRAMVTPQIEAKQLRFDSPAADGAPMLRADGARLERIVLNLLSNAVKFTAPGGRVSLAWERRGAQVVIRVSDTGIGIAPDKLEMVFEPFVRMGVAPGELGTGLGLAIGRDLARAMNGDLTAESEVGRGSTFVLTLESAEER